MKKQVLLLSLFIFPFLIHAQQQWVDFTRTTPQSPIIQLVSSDSTEVEFDVEVCGMYETDTTVNSTDFQRIIIPGGGLTTVIGEPEMPYIRQLIAIPECDSVTLSVTVTDTSSMQDYYVYPAPDFEEVYGQDSIIIIQEVFDFDTTAYSTDQSYPQVNAEIKSIGYFRDQKYAEVFIYPIQFNPVSEEILVNEEYEITLTFANPSTGINANVGIFNNIATNTMLNYTSTGKSAIINDNVSQNGTVEWVSLTDTSQACNIVADYLIICQETVFDTSSPNLDVLRIANHRATYNGFDVAILNAETIISDDLGFYYEGLNEVPADLQYQKEQRIRTCIRRIYEGANAQHTIDGKLGYVLLIGDSRYNFNSGMPTSYDPKPGASNNSGDPFPSDYYFSCLTKNNGEFDQIGDVLIGRFCVNYFTPGIELHNIVEKTIKFETEYCLDGWKNNITFTNGDFQISSYWDLYYGVLNDWISEYNTDLDVNSVNWYEENGQIKSPTLNMLNKGALTMSYLGHGTNNGQGWKNLDALGLQDNMLIEDFINNITYEYSFPFCSSISCENGRFDSYEPCMGEALTTYSANMGFVGFIGAGRSTWISLNNPNIYPPIDFQLKLPYSIWVNRSFIVGEFILDAKQSTSTISDPFAYNLFGDPGLNIIAKGYEVTHDVISINYASITKEVFVREDVTVTIPEDSTFYFETDGKLIIEEDATLEIEDNVTLSAISGVDSLIVYGDLIVGDSVTFESGSKAEFVIDIRNPDLIESISSATFDNVTLIAYAKALAFIDGTSFEDCSIELRKTANNQYFLDSCYFVNSPVTAKRHGQVTNRYLGNIEIDGCFFNNDNGSSAIYIDGFPNFQITDNELSYSTGDGISIYYAGLATGTSQEISSNLVEFTGNPAIIDAHGIKTYYSHADIENNHVYDNKTGLASLQRSSLSLKGNSSASTEDQTQRIQNNSDYQVYSDGTSFPYDFEYNSIYDDQASTYYVYMDTCLFTPYDIENNYWGGDFDELDNLYPWNAYDYDPEWRPSWGSLKSGDPAQDLFYSAKQNIIDSLYAEALTDFQEVIEDWPDSKYVKASVKELMGLTHIYGQDYTGLQDYLASVESLWEEEECIQITEYIINWCDVSLENYSEAIDWFEDRIVNPVSYEDSICSIIDLGYIYTLIDEGSMRSGGYTGNLVQYRPESREAYEKNRELLINLIPQRAEQVQAIDENDLSNKGHLLQVYPNPINKLATIEYSIEEKAGVMIKLHNSNGVLVRILNNSNSDSGSHSFTWNTTELAKGIYFISLEINGKLVETNRILLLK